MPAIGKQRRANRKNKVFRTRRDRFAVNSKPNPFTPLTRKLKSNNNLLAKALTAQKQETQLLFKEKIELTSQLQALTLACNKRDMVLANVQKNAKEMLTMLVTMTNYVTNTIMCCQEFCHKQDGNTPRPSSASAMRRESTRRLSTKSPARGVVKPMVSGHTITKPTINLRRVNMQRINNLLDLSIIDEASASPEPVNSASINNSLTHTAAFTSANRLGYEGERKRRLPERIPVRFVEADDDDRDSLDREETRLSGRFSGRISNSLARKRSESMLAGLTQSPSVSLCDVSKLLQNSQTINVRMLENSQGNGDLTLTNTVQNCSPHISNGDVSSITIAEQESERGQKGLPHEKSTKTVEKSNNEVEVDPLEGPSWLFDRTADDTEEKTVEIFRRKHTVRKLDSSESESEAGNNSEDDSMEFTECVSAVRKAPKIPTSQVVNKQNEISSNLPSRIVHRVVIENNNLHTKDLDNLSNHFHNDTDEQCDDFSVNRSTEFVTDRRQRYSGTDDEDDDTIMLKMSKGAKASKFDINDFRLPIVSCPIIATAESHDSEPEVTTTIQRIPQNNVPPNLLHINIEDRVSNVCSPQLPRVDDELPKTNKKKNRTTKRKQPKKSGRFDECESSDSDSQFEPKKRPAKAPKSTNVKDPSTAKVVLQKLTETHIKIRSTTPDQSFEDKTLDLDGTNQRMLETGNSELVTDSNSSTHSVGESSRPRRQKAPTNLKEPKLNKKLRR